MRHRLRPNQHLRDIQALTATDLRCKYPREYDSWRNMKQRRKRGYVVAPEFDHFADFLASMGPQPTSQGDTAWTVDRIDPSDPEYAPGKCRWLDKRGQANNRQRTIFLEYHGECLPLTIWAERTGQKPNTLRQRHAKGWSDVEVIHGRPKTQENPFTYRPWPEHRFAFWEKNYQNEKRPSEYPFQYYIRKLKILLSPLQDKHELYWDSPGYEEECAHWLEGIKRYTAALNKALERRPAWERAAYLWGQKYGAPSEVRSYGSGSNEDEDEDD